MDCRHAQTLLGLWVGQDLDDPGVEHALGQHVETCANCRRHRQSLVAACTALRDAQRPMAASRGVWRKVASRIAARGRRPQLARFNVWVPTLAAALACSLLVTVAIVEVQSRVGQRLGGMSRTAFSTSRDLFVSDPARAASHGRLLTEEEAVRFVLNHERQRNDATPRPAAARFVEPRRAVDW